MNKVTLWLVAIFLVGAVAVVEAQQPKKIPRIGYLARGDRTFRHASWLFVKVCGSLATLRGKNIIIEYRYAEGKLERLPVLAGELVRLKVDIIVLAAGKRTRAAKDATKHNSDSHVQDNDPVASGFVASLASPGGNITGLPTLGPRSGGKRLELLKEIIPEIVPRRRPW